ncbi:MAG: flagellar motor switch protein FliM, partial [Rhodospirillaceae bacterium]|nr:flagellar motor switch protein FliM [Rhodospirillaceae bacterium]
MTPPGDDDDMDQDALAAEREASLGGGDDDGGDQDDLAAEWEDMVGGDDDGGGDGDGGGGGDSGGGQESTRVLNQEEIDSLLFDEKHEEEGNKSGIQAILSSALVSYERLPMLEVVFD